ncbi:hypothetical protein C9374_005844 [Naegleria lovaniensis]|uniref:N-acetyltransferase domain-containing protein n=1 Tax=Naegleria lovaniensis TaxID=51637 RepID=A0AA88KIC1_NAELO|nr:uncharacterized protein C9374_005844 [Naegleria lovaniensis]KAG2382052.1 hypothetical protein C9374_005844 [Naegleria lovaniensis]
MMEEPIPSRIAYTEKVSSRKPLTTTSSSSSPKKNLASLSLPHYSVIMMNHTNGYHQESPLDYYYDQQEQQGFHVNGSTSSGHTTTATSTLRGNNNNSGSLKSSSNDHHKHNNNHHHHQHYLEEEPHSSSTLTFNPSQQQQAFLKNQKKSVNLSSATPPVPLATSMKNFGNSSSTPLSSLPSSTACHGPVIKTGVEMTSVGQKSAYTSNSPVSERNNNCYRIMTDHQEHQHNDLERYGHDNDVDEYYGNDENEEGFNIRPNSSHFEEDDFPSFENEHDNEQDASLSEQYNLKTMLTNNGDEKHQEEHTSENLTPANDIDRTFYKCNDNETIIIRSYNYKTDDKQVNRIFVEGIKSIVPSYLQTFYLFIHYFGIAKVFCFLSLFYLVTFGIHVAILKMLFIDENHTIVNHYPYYSLFGLSLSNSASTILYSALSTVILCTSTIILVLCGLSKYVDYSARSYIYQSFKYSDMANIMKYYIWDEDNHFWVAEKASTGEIVGTIGVRKKHDSEGCVELKRMSVANSMRRKGIASLMLNHLIQWSKEKGYNAIVLSTSSLQVAAVNFYQKNGFTLVKLKRHSRFLPTAHLTFEKHLTNSTTPPEYISTKHQ